MRTPRKPRFSHPLTRNAILIMRSIIAPVSALLLSVAFLMFGHGLQTTIIPIRAELEQIPDTAIGIISSFFFVGFVLGGILGPFLIVRAGHIRAFAAIVSIGSASALLHPLIIDTYVWAGARFISGFCLASMYLIIESWLNERATNTTRGMVMSAYTIIVFLAIMLGQVSTSFIDVSGFDAFVISSILLSIAAVPVALTKSAQPAPIALVRLRPIKLYKTSPAAIVSCFIVGMAIGALFTLLPLYASRVGVDATLVPFVAGALMLGGLLLQYPFGRFSDLVDRRYVLILGSIGTIATCFIIITFKFDDALILIGMITLLGGLIQPLYSISAAHAFDYSDPDDMVETAAGILLAYGTGSIFGPTLASISMDNFGPDALFTLVASVLLALVFFLLYRMNKREALSTEEKSDYDYASAAPVGAVIAPDLYEGEDDSVLVPEEYEMQEEADDEGSTSETPFSDDEMNEGTE